VTDYTENTKTENGNSKLDRPLTAPRVSNFDFRVSSASPHLSPQQLQFLLRVTPPALASQRIYEVPACVTIAQAILESATATGWGSSVLFRVANNPFGIKYSHFFTAAEMADECQESKDDSAGPQASRPGQEYLKCNIPNSRVPLSCPQAPARGTQHPEPGAEPYSAFDAVTWEIENGQKKIMTAQFARFADLDEAFHAHALLLRTPRYRPAFAVRDDWKQFAERLGPKASPLDSEHCGYSTNPSYSAELMKLVGQCRLDDPRAMQWLATGIDPEIRATEPSGHPGSGNQIGRAADEPMKRSARLS
jgi:flagellum-specific peptidoglycan hydrolase FlgJ